MAAHQCTAKTQRFKFYVERKLRDDATNPFQPLASLTLFVFNHSPFTSSHNEYQSMSFWKRATSGTGPPGCGASTAATRPSLTVPSSPMSSRSQCSCICHIISNFLTSLHSWISVLDGCVCCSLPWFSLHWLIADCRWHGCFACRYHSKSLPSTFLGFIRRSHTSRRLFSNHLIWLSQPQFEVSHEPLRPSPTILAFVARCRVRMRLVHTIRQSVAPRYSTSPLSTHNFRSSGSPRISEMIGRGIASPPASMGCLASTALGSSNCHGVPFKSQTQQCTSVLPATTSEASSFHDAFARHRNDVPHNVPRSFEADVRTVDLGQELASSEFALRTQALLATIASLSFPALPSCRLLRCDTLLDSLHLVAVTT